MTITVRTQKPHTLHVGKPDTVGLGVEGQSQTSMLIDATSATAAAADILAPKTAMLANGVMTTGTGTGGGGTTPAPQKQINFIDFDGTILYSYTAQEANALTALPANPTHSGLTAQGWNWTLAQIKAQLTAMPNAPVWVGQMYITQSGDTEIDVRMPEGRLSPILTIAVNGTITVDWGDNTTTDTVTGTSLSTRQAVPHTYAATGDYTMKIHAVSGSFTFYGSSNYTILRKGTTGNENRVYANCVKAIRLGSGITSIGGSAFYYCYSLSSITLPSGVTSIGNNAFGSCYGLSSITIPSTVTSIGSSTFDNCCILSSITLPSGVTSIGNNAFYYCYSLASITLPSTVTSIGSNAFYYCYSLASITLPSGVTSIESQAFYYCYSLSSITLPSEVTSIGASAFTACHALASVTIQSTVTSIGNSAFNNCYGVAEYHIQPTTPPTLGTTPFNNIVSDCVIYVPSAKVNDYKGATGWSDYASYIQGE